jgi:triosephosphate isomerase
MNKGLNEAKSFAKELEKVSKDWTLGNVVPVLAPAYPFLAVLLRDLEGSGVRVCAQDVSAHKDGAFTGEVSASMLASLGLPYCIVGHSERRAYHAESNEIIREKLLNLMQHDIRPILCVGETLEQRDAGITRDVVVDQLRGALHQITLYSAREIIVAYEPVWAIGTGRTATGEQAQEVHGIIRKWFADSFSADLADEIPILYGGSVKPENIDELLLMPDIDGGLIGGASLKPDSFIKMLKSALKYAEGAQ